MPVDTSSYQKYYNALQQAYGKDGAVEKGAFNLGYDDFKQKLTNQDYAQKIYGALDNAYGKQGVVEKGAFTLPFQDFYNKLSKPTSAAPTQQQPSPEITPPDISDIFRQHAKESVAIPAVGIPALPSISTSQQHSNEVQRAANNLTQTFNENKDKAINHILGDQLKKEQQALNSNYEEGGIDDKTYKQEQQRLFNRMVNPGVSAANFKQDMVSDPNKVRQVMDAIIKTNPEKASQLKADMYLMDSQKRADKANLILQNAHSIANDKGIDYDIKRGNLKKNEGFFESLGQGFSERNRMMKDYGFYSSEAPQTIINRLEGQRASYDPDLPVNTPYGIGGHLGQAIGSQGIVTAKAAVAGGVTSAIPVVGEIAAPWVAAAAASPEFYKLGYVSSLENEYHQLRNAGIAPEEALSRAKEKASFDAKVDVAQGAISTAVGTRIGIKPGEFSPTFTNSIKNIAVHSGKWLTETGMEGGANALIAGGLQELKNIHAGRPAEEGAFETGMGQLMFAYGLGALTKGGRALLNPKAYRSILQTMARAPEDEINTHLASMVKDGSITNDDASDIHSQLTQQHAADSKIPPEVTNDKDRTKIQDMIAQRDALDTKMEGVDKAYHPELKEQIKALNEKIAEASKNPSEPPVRPSTEPTFASPEDQQRLHENEIISQLKPPTHGEETKGNAEAEGQIVQPEGAATQAEAAPSIKPTSEKIQPTETFRTWDLGDMEGKPEDAAAKKHIEGVVQAWDKHPAGETGGETFGAFVSRVIPSFDRALKEDPHNTTIVTHSSVLKAMRVWDEMGRPDVEKLSAKQKKTFADKYNETETHNGDLETFNGTNGDVHVIRHGQTEDNAKNNFRSGNTNLTEKGIQDAHNVGNELADKTGGDVPKVITSDLPRAIHTSNIITDKLNEHALPIEPATQVLQREQGPDAGAGGERGRVEPSQQGNEPAGESVGQQPQEEGKGPSEEKPTVPPTHDADWPFVEEPEDNEVTSLKNAVTQQKVEDAGLLPAMKEARREFGEVWDEAQKKLAKGYDVEGLIDALKKKPRPITDLENAMILFHQTVKESQLEAASKELDAARAKGDRPAWNEAYNTRAKLLDDLQKLYDVDKAVGTANARGLNARKMMADRRFSLVNMQAEKRDTNGGEPLTDKQLEEVKAQFEEIKKTKEALETHVEGLKKENASLEAERNFLKLKGGIKEEKISQKKSAIKKDLADNFVELRKILKEQRSKLSANPIPVEAIPVIGKMAKNLVRLGAVKLSEVANHIYNELKGDIEGLTKDHVQEAIDAASNAERLARFKENVVESKLRTEMKTRTGDFSKKEAKPLILDREGLRLKGEYEKAKSKYEVGLKKDELAQRSKFQKTVDVFTKWERAFKLSNPVTLAKLSTAAITRLVQTPIEEGIGGVYSKAIPGLARKSEGEGGLNVKALAKAYKEAFTTGMKDAYDVLKSGKSNIDYALGKGEQLPPEAIEFFGQLHGAIKAPVKRFAFEHSLGKRLARNIANGVDVTDPEVQTRILMDAYKDAQRAIFMQDNFVSKQWTGWVSSLERSAAKKTNTQLERGLSKGTAATMQFLVPFVKVPTNIVGEVGTMTAGLPIAGVKVLHTAFTKGLSELTSDEADFILRNMKKGTLGAGALLLGYFRPDLFGGYYQPHEKRKEGDLKAGEMNVGGLHIPIWLLESPIFQTMQLGATIRKAKDKVVKGEEQGMGEGIWAGALGLAQHEPLIDQPARMSKIFEGKNERDYYLGELAKSTIDPAILDFAAKVTDPEKTRKPTTILEHVKTGIPGLRETVPTKKESDDRGGDTGAGGAGGGFDR